MKENSVILLSCLNNCLLAPMIDSCLKQGVRIEAVLIDGELSVKDQENVAKRLEPGYKIPKLSEISYPDVAFYFIKDHNSEDVVNKIKTLTSDYLINAGTPRILKKNILTVKKGVLNCHPGILPKYRGCTCVEWAIYNGDPVGATVHFMSEGIDEGPIVLSSAMEVKLHQAYETVRTHMIGFMAQLMVAGIKKCFEKDLSPERMSPQPAGSYFKPITEDKMHIVREKLNTGLYQSLIHQ